MTVARHGFSLAWVLMTACATVVRSRAPERLPSPPHEVTQPTASHGASIFVAVAAAESPKATPRPCGGLDCLAFPTPEAAFEYVLQRNPRVLAIGEAHAQQGTVGIRSSTRRFAEQLLPLLAGKSKHLVIELLLANCAPKVVAGVAQTQAPVTEHQSRSNQNEFLTLGSYAQRLGIEPQALAPSCAEYDAITAAGDAGVDRLLTLVSDQTRKSVAALLAEPEGLTGMVLTYGGALHNDLYPRAGQERWSFGPELAALSRGRYVELDLIVPEFVKDSEPWRNLPWFQAFDREHLVNEALLYRPAADSFVLIFPKTNVISKQGL